MSIFKYAIIGAAVAYGINYITKKRSDGTSILDELTESAPEWMEKAKQQAEQTIDQVAENLKRFNTAKTTTEPQEPFV